MFPGCFSAGHHKVRPAYVLALGPSAEEIKLLFVPDNYLHTHRVTYAECSLGNHIYYGRYLELLEAARGEFFRHLGRTFLDWQNEDTIFPVIECRLRYKNPAEYDNVLTTKVWVTIAERVRLNFAYRVLNQAGILVLEADTFHACTGLDEKPKRLPKELIDLLVPFLETRP